MAWALQMYHPGSASKEMGLLSGSLPSELAQGFGARGFWLTVGAYWVGV